MRIKNKKLLFIGGMTLATLAVCFLGWKLLTAIGIIGLPDLSSVSRSAVPHGFFLVMLLPIVATGTLFFGVAYTKK